MAQSTQFSFSLYIYVFNKVLYFFGWCSVVIFFKFFFPFVRLFVLFVVQSTHNKNHCKEDREHLGWKITSLGSLLKGIMKLMGNFCWWQTQLVTSVDCPEWARHSHFLRSISQKSDKNVITAFAPVVGEGRTFPPARFLCCEEGWRSFRSAGLMGMKLAQEAPSTPWSNSLFKEVLQEITSRWCLQLLMPWHTSQPCRSETSTIQDSKSQNFC